ncbi:MerR family transcriptional regulator [Robinsoniella peoriensis]|uniref:MerR family transcriptional regulator n=1 Tax=Robinsoniella peoriensis TaxID=180332 RepID=UPI0005C7BB84|nr:MerR family transcriptional regulator [Robinsoniella peoriensis]
MTIKEASEKTGISVDNLRYYERIGLIPEVPRSASKIRNYDDVTLSWIDFVMRFKRGGMALESIREYVQLAMEGEETKPARKDILLETKEQLEIKLVEIQESLDVISYKLDTYDQKCGPVTIDMVNDWKKKKEQES